MDREILSARMSVLGQRGALRAALTRTKPPAKGLPPLVARLMAEMVRQAAGDIRGVASRVGVDVQTLRNWKAGRSDPKLSLFLATADVLGYKLVLQKKTGENDG